MGREGKHNFHLAEFFMYIVLLNSHNNHAKQILSFIFFFNLGNSGSEPSSHSVISREATRVGFRINPEPIIFCLHHSASIFKDKLSKKNLKPT